MFITPTCSFCSLIPRCLSKSWVLDACCDSIQVVNLILKFPLLLVTSLVILIGSVVGFILLINARSLPLVWHINVFLPCGIEHCKYRILSFYHTIMLRPRATRHRTVVSQLESRCPVGVDPFQFSSTNKTWASPDETDWFGHARDIALSKFGLTAWPTFVNAGGRFILSSTHYHFLHEIPRFAEYEMKMEIGAWDHKWLYLVCRFTSSKSLHKVKRHETTSATASKSEVRVVPDQLKLTILELAGEPDACRSSDDDVTDTSAVPPREKSDGRTLHCFTVSRLCFKMGRITVPPAIVMSCEGFSKPSPCGSYSHQSPPPHWVHPHALRNAADSLEIYRRFLAGGWRDVAEADRWWIEPLSGPIEERRRTNLAKLEGIDRGVVDCMNGL